MAQADSTIDMQEDNASSPAAEKSAPQRSLRLPRIPLHLLIGAVLFGLSLCFNLYRLGAPSIWFDEAFSVELARHPVPQIWQIIFGPEPNMELYYLFLHYWLALTGYLGLNPTEFIVRFPSAIFSALSTVVVFALGRRYLGLFAGTIGALLYLLNFLQLYYDLQTRAYGLQLFLICVSWYALLTAISARRAALPEELTSSGFLGSYGGPTSGNDSFDQRRDTGLLGPGGGALEGVRRRISSNLHTGHPQGPHHQDPHPRVPTKSKKGAPKNLKGSALEEARGKQTGPSTAFWWSIYVLSTVLAVYAHLFSILIICAQFCAVAGLLVFARVGGPLVGLSPTEAHKRSSYAGKDDDAGGMSAWRTLVGKQAMPFVISLVVTGVLSIPMLLVSMQGAKTGWLPSPHLHDLINFLYNMGGYNKIYLFALLGCCALGVLIPLLMRVPAVGRFLQSGQLMGDNGPMIWMLLCWFLVPVVVSYVVSQGATRLFSARYLVVVVPALTLLAGLGIALLSDVVSQGAARLFSTRSLAVTASPLTRLLSGLTDGLLRWRIVQVVLAVVMIGIALSVVPFYYHSVQVEDWNTAVPWLQQRYQPGDGLVCYDNTVNGAVKQGCQISVEYYLYAYPGRAHFTIDAPGAFSWTTYSAPNPDAAVDQSALAAYAAQHPHLFLIAGRVRDEAAEQRLEAAQQWMAARYHLVNKIETPTVRIWLFDTTGKG